MYLTESFLEPLFPVTHALVGDWFTLLNFMILFFYGLLLISVEREFWDTVTRNRRLYLYLGIMGFSLWLGLVFSFRDTALLHFTVVAVKVFNLWTWILVLFCYASRYLSQPGRIFAYANEAVSPFYILYQTMTIIIGYYLLCSGLDFLPAFTILVIGTFGCSWLIYDFAIRPWALIRPLFGFKDKKCLQLICARQGFGLRVEFFSMIKCRIPTFAGQEKRYGYDKDHQGIQLRNRTCPIWIRW